MSSDLNAFGRRRDVIIYANRASASAGLLGLLLGCRRWLVERPKLAGARIASDRTIINWGTSVPPNWLNPHVRLLNDFTGVSNALSKVKSYELFRAGGVPTITSTNSPEDVSKWLSEGHRVLARRDGLSSGKGIRILDPARGIGEDSKHDFYALYFRKTHEYRVHVVDGRVIDITQKKIRNGLKADLGRTTSERIVRSLDNGWVHAHEDLHLPDKAKDQIFQASIHAVSSLGLDFGACDILARFSKKDETKLLNLAVCEVNTAPGLENEVTIEAYKKAFEALI